jgi:hypothetical protein
MLSSAWRRLLARWLTTFVPGNRRPQDASTRRDRRARPQLDALEERVQPTVITWTNTTGGSWQVASNWTDTNSVHRTPSVGDDVVIPDLTGTQTITYSSGTSTIGSLTSSENVTLSGGTLNVTGNIQDTAAQLTLQGGHWAPAASPRARGWWASRER